MHFYYSTSYTAFYKRSRRMFFAKGTQVRITVNAKMRPGSKGTIFQGPKGRRWLVKQWSLGYRNPPLGAVGKKRAVLSKSLSSAAHPTKNLTSPTLHVIKHERMMILSCAENSTLHETILGIRSFHYGNFCKLHACACCTAWYAGLHACMRNSRHSAYIRAK